jgi:hypothetical protein
MRLYVNGNLPVRLRMIGGPALAAPNQNSPTFLDISISGHLVDEI